MLCIVYVCLCLRKTHITAAEQSYNKKYFCKHFVWICGINIISAHNIILCSYADAPHFSSKNIAHYMDFISFAQMKWNPNYFYNFLNINCYLNMFIRCNGSAFTPIKRPYIWLWSLCLTIYMYILTNNDV